MVLIKTCSETRLQTARKALQHCQKLPSSASPEKQEFVHKPSRIKTTWELLKRVRFYYTGGYQDKKSGNKNKGAHFIKVF